MANERPMVMVKLDHEQMDYIKKNYLDVIERVIQERKEIKVELDCILEHAAHAWNAYDKLRPEDVTINDPSCWPPDITAGVGSIAYHMVAMIEYAKQLSDSIEIVEENG